MRFRKTLVALTAALVALCVVAGSAQAAPVVNNASFEDDTFGTFPGYVGAANGQITGWTASATNVGLNPAAGSPFANNGTIPAGSQVAFIQNNTGTLSQTITGLEIGETYRVFYNYNARSGPAPRIKVTMGGTVLQENTFPSVGGTNPYYAGAREFTATATEHDLVFENTMDVGDSTVLVDNVTVELSTEWGVTIGAWTDDSAIPAGTYTHAVNFAGTDVTINGVNFTGAAGPNPSWGDYSTAGIYSTAGMPQTIPNDTNNVTGDSAVMATTFLYGGDTSSLTINGLVPGREYITTIYTVGWDNQPGSRIASFAASAGGVPIGDAVTFNQNEMGNNNGMALSFRFPAPATSLTVDVDPYTGLTWHYYGFTNRDASPQNDLIWNGNAGDLLWHSANWTGPVATPNAETNATVVDDTVIIAADAVALSLEVQSGGIAIDGGKSLDVSYAANFASGTTLALGDGATLAANSGTLDAVTTAADATINVRAGEMPVTTLTAAAGTITKQGAGTLLLDNSSGTGVIAGSATLRIEGGVLDTTGVNPLGGATEVTLAGGSLSVDLPLGLLRDLSSGFDQTSGVTIANGDPDPDYILTVSPQDLPEDLPKSATVIENHPAWLANSATSKWIGPVDPGVTDVAAGDYQFETTFDLSGVDLATVGIALNLASDNLITNVLLNGISTGITQAGFGGFSPTQTVNTGLVDGLNTLTFVLNNAAPAPPAPPETPGGLRVEGGVYPLSPIDLKATTIVVDGGGALDVDSLRAVEFGPVVLKTGTVTTAGTVAKATFDGTTLDAAASAVGINAQALTYPGAIDGTALTAPATLAKTGLADLIMDQPGVNLGQLMIDVQQGRLIGVQGSNPFHEARLQLGGGTLELAAAADNAVVTFDNALNVTADSTLTAGPGHTGTSGAAVTLGSAANGVTLGADTVLTVQTTDDYTLELAGVIAGPAATFQVSGGGVTIGQGGNIGSLSVPGGLLEANGDVNVDTLSVQLVGSISTDADGISVNDGGTAEIGPTTFVTTGGTMSFAGSVLVTGAETLALGGGTVTATAPGFGDVTPGLSYHRITNDADSGIDPAKTYTHAIDFGTDGTSPSTVNGVAFANDFADNGDYNNLYRHPGGAGPFAVDINSDVWGVFDDMDYNGTEILLTGLTPGESYELRFYNRAWGVGANRNQTFTYDIDDDGSIEETVAFNADDASAAPASMGNADAAYAMSYTYTAGATGQIKVGLAPEAAGNTYHLYGLTNEVALGSIIPLPADITLPNLIGIGTLNAGAVDVLHTIAPGIDGIGKITVGEAELVMDAGVTYNAQISLADVDAVVADQLEVTNGGLLELGGTLAVSTLNDRTGADSWSNPKLTVVNNVFGDILDGTAFADITPAPPVGNEPATHIGQGAFLRGVNYDRPVAGITKAVELDVFVALAGDTDGDKKVWLSDWAALRANFGNTATDKTWIDGNFDPWEDSKVWLSDWAALRANFGNVDYTAAGAAAVPEPGTIAMLLAALLCVASVCRRRRV